MTETVNIEYELETTLDINFLNNNLILPKSFNDMISKLKKVNAIDDYWAQTIIDDNTNWDENVYEDFCWAIKKLFVGFLTNIELEMNFHDLLCDYFYNGEFKGTIYLYGNFSVETKNSMSIQAYRNGMNIDLSMHGKKYVESNIEDKIVNEYSELGIVSVGIKKS